MLRNSPNREKKQKKPRPVFIFSIGVFLSLKRCNLATFKLQQTLSLSAKKLTKQKKRQKNPVVDCSHSLILKIGVLYCLKRLISAFQLV
ncbi:MAG: hypothetical protein PG978_000103 [Wolbachia endosymbiont of Ctenocephalides felis wCfeF]|nr:MAG: hypothetical protein PG978_000103 [Wolbachia endosymbiont of Ctenocephalides felis wCfeF]